MDLDTMQQNAGDAAAMLKTLANPSRLLVLCALVSREYTAGELENLVGLSQSAVSQHLARLRHTGLVQTRRDGQRIVYSIGDKNATKVLQTLHDIYCEEL